MMLIIRADAKPESVEALRKDLEQFGFTVQEIQGQSTRIFGLAGDTTKFDPGTIAMRECVERIVKVQEPYKMANRKFHPLDTVMDVQGRKIGGGELAIMAGPCSVESEEQILSVAKDVKASGASFLRGGAFKPRTSPYAFQGMGLDGLELLKVARKKTGLPIVTEIMSVSHLPQFVEDVDIIQVGARNMQNFDLLKEIGRTDKPVLIKRGPSSTVEELLMSAEYVLAGGNSNVILCERGIRTFENYTRNTLDISAVPVLKKLTHLPVIVDPSHASGMWWLVEPLALAAVACGADGLIIEVHNDPASALCDGQQSITPAVFHRLMGKLSSIHQLIKGENP